MNSKTAEQPSSISGRIGAGGKQIVDSIVEGLAMLRVHPNILTLIGLLINIFAMVLFAKGIFLWAGVVIVVAGIFDMVDGEVARRTKRVTKFGAFFDSVIDRYSDMLLLLGLVIWYAKINRIFYVGLTGLVLIGSVLTSYTRARAESLIPACKVGFLERPERIVLLIIGSLTDRMAAVLWVMAILSNWTVSQRIWYTWRETSAMERLAPALLISNQQFRNTQYPISIFGFLHINIGDFRSYLTSWTLAFS
jgi:CDP-diacylglycerol--glycerol-3-phosphate 3-phosphatidyltransferase